MKKHKRSLHRFERYLRDWNMADLWPARERSEVLQWVYLILRVCVRERCDTLTVTARGFSWSRDGLLVDQRDLSLGGTPPKPDCREHLRVVHNRDAMVRDYLQPVADGPEAAVYRLVPGGRATPEPPPERLTLDYGTPYRRARFPRESWGARDRPTPPYDLTTLERARYPTASFLVHDGIASSIGWVARADPAVSVGLAEALAESIDSGWSLDEGLEHSQVLLEDGQEYVDEHPEALDDTLRVSHTGPAQSRPDVEDIRLTGQGLADGHFLLIPPEVYAALTRADDRFLAARAEMGGQWYLNVFVVRGGTVMAAIHPGHVGGDPFHLDEVPDERRVPRLRADGPRFPR